MTGHACCHDVALEHITEGEHDVAEILRPPGARCSPTSSCSRLLPTSTAPTRRRECVVHRCRRPVRAAPARVQKAMRSGGGFATVGVSVYAEGVDIVYQSFFLDGRHPDGGPARSGRRQVQSGVRTRATERRRPTTGDGGVGAVPLVQHHRHPGGLGLVGMSILDGTVTMSSPSYDQSVLAAVGYRNTSPAPVDFTATHAWQYAVNATVSVTNAISVKGRPQAHLEQPGRNDVTGKPHGASRSVSRPSTPAPPPSRPPQRRRSPTPAQPR